MTDIDTARRLLSPHFATDGEEGGPGSERIAVAVETLIGSIAEALSVAREEGRRQMNLSLRAMMHPDCAKSGCCHPKAN